MELRSRTRQQLRRAVFTAALGTLIVPATAGAAVKTPVITKVTPKTVSVGETLIVHGKNFRRGKAKNTLLFKRDGGKALFVKTGVATKTKIIVAVPKSLEKYMAVKDGKPSATRFRLRVLTTKLGKAFTSVKASPVVGPEKLKGGAGDGGASVDPNADCDGDGLTNSFETGVTKTQACNSDSDGDGATDGYEYASAVDLNNDDYRQPTASLPFPGKRPYPNPLDGTDINTDFDGDGLALWEEFKLWRYTVQKGGSPSLTTLSYSDGLKFSVYTRDAQGRRIPALAAAGYDKAVAFRTWLTQSGYGTIVWPDQTTPRDILDFDRSGFVDSDRLRLSPGKVFLRAEDTYLDTHSVSGYQVPDGLLNDDERDEDGDGLSNYVESGGPLSAGWFKAKYTRETPFRISYAGTDLTDEDTDGDGVLDGADDQDHDDVPNVTEQSRNMITGRDFDDPEEPVISADGSDPHGRVDPFNPCLPFTDSRTCPTYIPFASAWAPFDWETDPDYLVLN